MNKPLKIIHLGFTVLEFHHCFVISRPGEDEIVGAEQLKQLIEACSNFYNEKKFVYLSQRVNNYSVNPTIYLRLEEVKNLAGIGIVSTKTSSLKIAQFERNFSRIPYEIFLEQEEAIAWARDILKK